MKRITWFVSLLLLGAGAAHPGVAAENPFLGQWALNPAAGGAGWLEVRRADGTLTGTLLWLGGSPMPQSRVWLDGDQLVALRVWTEDVRDTTGKVVGHRTQPALLTATLAGSEMRGTLAHPSRDGASVRRESFSGVRVPPPPTPPDLAKVHFGEPIPLFNGKTLDGWKLVEADAANGWSVQDGLLVNDPAQTPGQPRKHYGNLRTVREFEDFNLMLEVNVGKGQNSGVYLRGIYEVQVADTFGQPIDPHNMGAIYGRITPSVAAEKSPGEWQSLDITLVQRHATVKLNGQTIVDNAPLNGCTGGALWSDLTRPGPIYLQGDHTGIKYRNLVLRPVVK